MGKKVQHLAGMYEPIELMTVAFFNVPCYIDRLN